MDTLANPSAATAMLTIANLQFADAGNYDCIVTTACGSVTSAPATLAVGRRADLNHDNSMDTLDLVFFLGRFGQQAIPGLPAALADFNGDGTVNSLDLVIFLAGFGQSCPWTGVQDGTVVLEISSSGVGGWLTIAIISSENGANVKVAA